MARRRPRDRLAVGAEQMALDLMFEATNGRIGKQRPFPEGVEPKEVNVSFTDRRALLDSVVKLMAKRHDMAPDDEEPDGIESFRSALNGPSGESGDRGVKPEAEAGSSDPDPDADANDLV